MLKSAANMLRPNSHRWFPELQFSWEKVTFADILEIYRKSIFPYLSKWNGSPVIFQTQETDFLLHILPIPGQKISSFSTSPHIRYLRGSTV